MPKFLSLLAALTLIAAPFATAQASTAYSVSATLNHMHLTQGHNVTITGRVRGGSTKGLQVAIHARDGAEPYADHYLAGYAKISSSGAFTVKYAPVIAGRLFFYGVVVKKDHTAISDAGPKSHSLTVTAAHPKNSRHQMVVIGDSISDPSLYNDRHGSVNRAWWSYLSSKTGLQANVFAQRGSGYIRMGECTSSTIGGRVTYSPISTRLAKAAVVVLEAGVNDYDECKPNHDGVLTGHQSTYAHRKAAIDAAMANLDDIVPNNHKVYVIVPWGPRDAIAKYRDEIVDLVQTAAVSHGFQYVDMAHGTLNDANTKDGVHPNADGTVDMYRRIYLQSNLRARFPKS